MKRFGMVQGTGVLIGTESVFVTMDILALATNPGGSYERPKHLQNPEQKRNTGFEGAKDTIFLLSDSSSYP